MKILAKVGPEAPAKTLAEMVDDCIAEVNEAEQAAARDRPTIDRPPRNRLMAIQKCYAKILREIDGSIDSVLADWIEANCKEALARIETYTLGGALAA